MLTPAHLWPIDEVWRYPRRRAASSRTSKSSRKRWRPATARPRAPRTTRSKAQALAYEGERAMFEALRAQQVHVHRRDPVDAQQRLAVDDLAPLRLLPAPGRRVLRHQEGLRAGPRAVRCTTTDPSRSSTTLRGAMTGVTVSATVLDFSLRTRFTRDAVVDLPADAVVKPIALPEIAGAEHDLLPSSHSEGRLGRDREPQFLLAVDARGGARLRPKRSGTTRPRARRRT